MVDVKKFSEIDLYGLLGVEIGATEAEIRKAYRKKALQCHPDKNPDNPKAAELFQELSKALEILIDASARSAYDKLLNAKKAAQLRTQQLDSKRQKLKNDLEERERRAREAGTGAGGKAYKVNKTPEELFQEEFERLRKEGSKLIEEEQELMRQQMREERDEMQKGTGGKPSWDSSQHRIKIKWKVEKGDEANNGGYSQEILQKFLSKYGDINVLVMSPKKSGSALVEFRTQEAAEMAVSYEQGRLDNPCKLEWIGEAPKGAKKAGSTSGSTITDRDYESLVLRQLRQAEERKRLIEQMMRDEAAEEGE